MLPAVVIREIEAGIKSFLKTTFPPSTPTFEGALEAFLDEPGRVFKGPYYSLRLPFRPAPDGPPPFRHIPFPYHPHLHQAQALARLCGDRPRSTLVATGTGSGKTECFLYPILDACAERADEPGIKAIIIYPMNALATDQAKRFAKAIYSNEKLRGKVTAGLFIGGESDQSAEMREDWLITNKNHLREHPPDILLTNYKMLDFLLLRPEEQDLWRDNKAETLRFLVVDELHTFDGAQSTDLACLLRRLKTRLRSPADHLCCVGTSATLGSSESSGPLLEYARTVFAEPFDDDAVIEESLLTLAEIVDGYLIRFHGIPDAEGAVPADSEKSPEGYLTAQYRLWFEKDPPADFLGDEGRLALGERLREHSFFRNLLTLAERSGRKVYSEEWLLHETTQMLGGGADIARAKWLLDGFFSLCAHARYRVGDDPPGPLLRVHAHLWTRELSRLVASVTPAPRLAFSDDLKGEAMKNHLPVMHCRECGAMGWGGTMRANAEKVSTDLQEFYKAFFGRHPNLRLFFPVEGRDGGVPMQEEFTHMLCGQCLTVNAAAATRCSGCGAEGTLVHVLVHDRSRRVQDRTEADRACPFCESTSGLAILGSRAASLTSIALSQLYTSPFNSEKQALAFSDNVQDASHRSSFFAARTFRVNLRTAIRRVIADATKPLTLAELQSRFLKRWRAELGDLGFIGLFLAPNMEWLDDYETIRREGRLPAGSHLVKLVERRVAWEIASEFGFNSRIGRTLEKSGAAIAFVDPEHIGAAARILCEKLREKAGGFGAIKEEEATALLGGLIHRLRTGGGIYHEELDDYVNRGGDSYLLGQRPHMPKFGKSGRAPSFFYQGPGRIPRFEKLVAGGTALSWAQRWTIKSLCSIPNLSAEAAEIVLEEAKGALVGQGIWTETAQKGDRIWGIPPERLLLTTEVRLMTCRQCGHSISCAPQKAPFWENAPCLRQTCGGQYAPQPEIRDYFGDLYRTGDVVRIRTAEHTGLLEREEREWIENRFMARPPERRSTDPNLLSCTPTLEMGVNIGDLSSVVLCAVPPATSNYVQRVGRAGRKEGSAVSLTIASAQAHDLYYYELPEDMMAGTIHPPGTFLDAPAVLERQFTAFCLDRWSEQDNPRPILPAMVAPVLDTVKDPEGKTGFPYDFFKFTESNLDALLQGFLGLFGEEELAPDSRATLERFARGDAGASEGLTHKILGRLSSLAEDRTDLQKRLQKVGRAIQKNRKITARDEALEAELDELKQHRNGIYEMLKQIHGKMTLNFFTDEGLLPNYAFPEEGVQLRSVILKRREQPKATEGKYKALTFEYVRPAASAITELAPGNTFYVEGRRLKVDQVSLRVSPIESWHFCDVCGHMEMIGQTESKHLECPACGSPNWPDASLKRDLIRLRQVVSTTADRHSRTDDAKDQRDEEFFNHHESVVIPHDAEREAYQIRGAEVPFGFEFLGKLTFRVVNLGQDSAETQPYRLGGREISSAGFSLCPDCGKVQAQGADPEEDEMKHDLSCRYRGKATAPLKAVFLYRELHSEALCVLLPSSGAEMDAAMASFVAALHLGLRLYFRGSIDHLRSCVDERPIPGTTLRRKYLVVYDQVPGGTGYLKQLSKKPEVFLEVLRRALKHLTECECATRSDHGTDGCHRCILQARHRRDHADLSRTTAIRQLETILANANQLERVNRVSEIDVHPLIRSELEKVFIESLRSVHGAQLQKKIVHGKPGYLWLSGETAWEVVPQVQIGTKTGVGVPSVPDFVMYPVRPDRSRPIAVFLDGFAYHADEASGHNRIAEDVQQRQALIHSGKFWVWSLCWEDVQHRNNPTKIIATALGESHAARRNQMARGILSGDALALAEGATTQTSWGLFLQLLARPSANAWASMSYLYALALPEQMRRAYVEDGAGALEALCQDPSAMPDLPESATGDGYAAPFAAEHITGIAALTEAGATNRDTSEVFLALRFDDDSGLREPKFPAHWRGFLRLMNRLQFIPNAHVITSRGCRAGRFAGLADAYRFFLSGGQPAPSAPAAPVVDTDAIAGDSGWVDPAIAPLLRDITERGLANPTIGFELEEGGRIVASAEAAWTDQKIALIDQEMGADQDALQERGWSIFAYGAEGLPAEPHQQIIEKLSGGS